MSDCEAGETAAAIQLMPMQDTEFETSHPLTPSPSHSSASICSIPFESLEGIVPVAKKKKKKRAKKAAKTKAIAELAKVKDAELVRRDGRPPVLCISRNKHWKYISSYHVSLRPFSRCADS